MPISDDGKAILLALEILARQVQQQTFNLAEWATRPVRGREPDPSPGGELPGPSRSVFSRSIGRVAEVAGRVATRFGALLAPMASFNAVLSAPTSGLSVLTSALRLFSASIAPLVLPALFSLSVGLAASSDVIFHKLLPALDGFTRYVLGTAVPAMIQFAETAGRAVEALKWIADSKVGRAVGASGGGGEGGYFGAINRSLDRLGRVFDSSIESPDDEGERFVVRAERSIDDAARAAFPVLIGSAVVGAKNTAKDATNWLTRNIGIGNVFGSSADAIAPGSSDGLRGTSSETRLAADRARLDSLRELQIQMMPRATVGGGAASVWTQAQAAAFQSPFERRTLEMLSEVIKIMSKAVDGPGGIGTLTEGDRRAADELLRRRRGG